MTGFHARKATRSLIQSFIHLCFSTNVTSLDKFKTRSTVSAGDPARFFTPFLSHHSGKKDLSYVRVSVHTRAQSHDAFFLSYKITVVEKDCDIRYDNRVMLDIDIRIHVYVCAFGHVIYIARSDKWIEMNSYMLHSRIFHFAFPFVSRAESSWVYNKEFALLLITLVKLEHRARGMILKKSTI